MMRLSLSLPALALAAGLVASGETRAGHFQSLSASHTAYGVSQFNYGNVPGNTRPGQPAIKIVNPNHLTQIAAFVVYQSARGRHAGSAELYMGCVVRELGPHASIAVHGRDFPDETASGETVPTFVEAIWAPVDTVSVTLASTSATTTVGVATPPAQSRAGRKKDRDDDDDNDHDDDDDDDDIKRTRGGRTAGTTGGTVIATRLADGLGGFFQARGPGSDGPARMAHPAMFSLPLDSPAPGQRQMANDCLVNGLADLGLGPEIFADFGIK